MTLPADVQRLSAVTIEGPAGRLEAVLQTLGSTAPETTALICHPHPVHGGTLHNKVVHRVASTLLELGVAVMRFNFRGVGKSEGTFGGGAGERDDAHAALEDLARRFPGARRWVAGFSFGAWVAAMLASAQPGIDRLLLVAPPIDRWDFEALRASRVPKLVIQGTADPICPIASLERALPTWADPKRLIRVEGANHFFDKQLGELASAVRQALAERPGGGPS